MDDESKELLRLLRSMDERLATIADRVAVLNRKVDLYFVQRDTYPHILALLDQGPWPLKGPWPPPPVESATQEQEDATRAQEAAREEAIARGEPSGPQHILPKYVGPDKQPMEELR